jgi:hypothetical protein
MSRGDCETVEVSEDGAERRCRGTEREEREKKLKEALTMALYIFAIHHRVRALEVSPPDSHTALKIGELRSREFGSKNGETRK